jgi:GNAT superfamily N-acetyltransferase
MVCFNTQRPFSLDKKKVEIDQYIPQGAKTVEIRLLAVEKEWRKSNIAYKLFKILAKKLIKQGIYMGFISATTRQLELYKKIGFAPFDELVGIDGAFYQPMRITFDNLKKEFKS